MAVGEELFNGRRKTYTLGQAAELCDGVRVIPAS
jgi:hypothetical protein